MAFPVWDRCFLLTECPIPVTFSKLEQWVDSHESNVHALTVPKLVNYTKYFGYPALGKEKGPVKPQDHQNQDPGSGDVEMHRPTLFASHAEPARGPISCAPHQHEHDQSGQS